MDRQPPRCARGRGRCGWTRWPCAGGCGWRPGGFRRPPFGPRKPASRFLCIGATSRAFPTKSESKYGNSAPDARHLRLIKGNPGRRPIHSDEPIPRPGRPPMPRHLSPKAREAWRRFSKLLQQMGVLTPADGPALERMCEAWAAGIEARASLDRAVLARGVEIARGGEPSYVSQGADGMLARRRPELALIADADRRLLAYFCHFGMTPAARAKVAVAVKPTRDRAARYFD